MWMACQYITAYWACQSNMDERLEQSARPCQSIARGLAFLGSWDMFAWRPTSTAHPARVRITAHHYHLSKTANQIYSPSLIRNGFDSAAAAKAAYGPTITGFLQFFSVFLRESPYSEIVHILYLGRRGAFNGQDRAIARVH